MTIKKILTAAAAAAILSLTGMSTASAASYGGYGSVDRHDLYSDARGFDDRDGDSGWNRDRGDLGDRDGDSGWNRDRGDHRFGWQHRRVVDRRVVFATLRFNHIRHFGDPYFVRGHYVVRTFDRFGRVALVEINPYTGRLIGYVRL